MESGSITIKDIVGWIIAILISLIGSLVPLLIEIKKVKKMLYKEIIARKDEIIARKDLENKELKKENEELKKKLEENKERN